MVYSIYLITQLINKMSFTNPAATCRVSPLYYCYNTAVRWSFLILSVDRSTTHCYVVINHPQGIISSRVNHPSHDMVIPVPCLCNNAYLQGPTREQRSISLRRRESDSSRPRRHISLLCLFSRAKSCLWESRWNQSCPSLLRTRLKLRFVCTSTPNNNYSLYPGKKAIIDCVPDKIVHNSLIFW